MLSDDDMKDISAASCVRIVYLKKGRAVSNFEEWDTCEVNPFNSRDAGITLHTFSNDPASSENLKKFLQYTKLVFAWGYQQAQKDGKNKLLQARKDGAELARKEIRKSLGIKERSP